MGRIVGLVLLGLLVATIGFFTDLSPLYFVLTFGVLSILFGFIVIAQTVRLRERVRHLFHRKTSSAGNSPSPASISGPIDGRCHSGSGNACEHREGYRMRRFKNSYVFALGIARGATPCLKIMVLLPLLVAVDIYLALAMILVYALASTIYPVIGYLSGNLLRSVEKHSLYVKMGAAVVLVTVGIYSILNVLIRVHPSGGS